MSREEGVDHMPTKERRADPNEITYMTVVADPPSTEMETLETSEAEFLVPPDAIAGSLSIIPIIQDLISSLGSDEAMLRRKARESLVLIGEPAVNPLIRELTNPDDDVRWGAAKALAEIVDPLAAEALVRALEDESFAVRWIAAGGLIALGRYSIPPLMTALEVRSNSVWLREGAHHVLRGLSGTPLRRLVCPVIAALEGPEPVVEVPLVALVTLDRIGKSTRRRWSAAA
jgi:HEAT repeat protein